VNFNGEETSWKTEKKWGNRNNIKINMKEIIVRMLIALNWFMTISTGSFSY
jgi:hypothetical protein